MTEVFIILICSQKWKNFFYQGIHYKCSNCWKEWKLLFSLQLQIWIMLQIMSRMMRIFPIISWSKVKKQQKYLYSHLWTKNKFLISNLKTCVWNVERSVSAAFFSLQTKIQIMLQLMLLGKKKQCHLHSSQYFEHVLSLLRKDFSFFLPIIDDYYPLMYV